MPERRSKATALTGLAVGAIALVLIAAGNGHGTPRQQPAFTLPPPLHFSFSVARQEREGRAIERVLSYTPYIAVGSPRRRDVALTFDDGPGPYTRAILLKCDVCIAHVEQRTVFQLLHLCFELPLREDGTLIVRLR